MAKKASKPASIQVVLASRIKEVAKAGGVRVSGDFVEAANKATVE